MEEFTNQQILDAAQVMPVRVLVKSKDDSYALREFMHDNGFEWASCDSLLERSCYKDGLLIAYVFEKTWLNRGITRYSHYSDERGFWEAADDTKKSVVYKPQQVECAISFDDLFGN